MLFLLNFCVTPARLGDGPVDSSGSFKLITADNIVHNGTDKERPEKTVMIKVYVPTHVRDELFALAERRSESVSKTALAAIRRFLVVAAAADIERSIHSDPEYQRLMDQS